MQASIKENRNLYIGGSDIPIIMGISPFKSRYDLLLEKAGLKEDDFEGNEYTEYGNIMEKKIRNFINEKEENKFIEGKHVNGDIRCHTDGENTEKILEIKTTSKIYDDVDDYKVYLVQLLFYMENTGREKGKLAVYERPKNFDENFDGERLNIYDIDIKNYEKLLDKINAEVEKFREDLEKIKENPFMEQDDLIPVDIRGYALQIEAIEKEIQRTKELEKSKKEFLEKLYNSMEKNNIKKWETNNGFKFTKVDKVEPTVINEVVFDETSFALDFPETYKKYKVNVEKKKNGRNGYVKVTLPKDF